METVTQYELPPAVKTASVDTCPICSNDCFINEGTLSDRPVSYTDGVHMADRKVYWAQCGNQYCATEGPKRFSADEAAHIWSIRR